MAEVACNGGAVGVDASTTMSTEQTVSPSAQEEESDEELRLELHVSDSEEADVTDKNNDEIPMEIEDDILNKFEIQEKNLKLVDVQSENKEEDKGKSESEKIETDEATTEKKKSEEKEEDKKSEEKEEEKKSEEQVEEEKSEEKVEEKKSEEKVEEKKSEEKVEEKKSEEKVEEKKSEEKVEEKKSEKEEERSDKTITENKEETKTAPIVNGEIEKKQLEKEIENDKNVIENSTENSNHEEKQEESEKEKEVKTEEIVEEEKNKTEDDSKAYEEHDLLTVMEEKTTEADETEFENEIEEHAERERKMENENGEVSGNNTDENQSDSEGQLQYKTESEDADNQMDMEDDDEDPDDPQRKEEEVEMEVTDIEYKVETGEEICSVKLDENKENVENCNGVSVLESLLNDSKPTDTKSTKRVLSDDSSTEDESVKKIKLAEEKPLEEKPQDISVKQLNSFKKYMLDKSLKGITREQLEIFCIQKMCECIVQKSEIGELKVKVKQQEQMLDCLRKEVLNVGKQTRDLNIVHQKVIQDVGKLQENNDKPLVVPKITRSVGLQAVVRVDETKRKVQRATVLPTKLLPIRQKPANTTPTRNNVTNYALQKKNTTPTTPNTPIRTTTTTTTTTTPNTTQKATPKTPEANGKAGGVIDLTDEDDSKKSTVAPTPNGTKVNMINAPAGHKFVVMPNGQTVMVKISQTPVVTQTQARTTNGVVRGSNSTVRTLTPVRNIRPMAPSPIRAKTPTGPRAPRPVQNANFRNQPQKILQHPAPLPNAAAVHVDGAKAIPPKPHLMLNKTSCGTGIVLSWKMPYKLDLYEKIASYQLYAYQETKSEPKTENWGKIGDVKALELPMAVTLTHFAVGNRYFFAVRAVDNFSRPGEFSHYETILL